MVLRWAVVTLRPFGGHISISESDEHDVCEAMLTRRGAAAVGALDGLAARKAVGSLSHSAAVLEALCVLPAHADATFSLSVDPRLCCVRSVSRSAA